MTFDPAELWLSAPLLVVITGALVLLLLESYARASLPGAPRGGGRSFLGPLALIVLGIAAAFELGMWRSAETAQTIYHGMLAVDRFGIFLALVFFVGAGLSVLLAGGFMREHRFEFGEFYALVLLATAGMMILAQASDLVTLFIGLETMSLAVYVLTGSWRRSAKSSEAALKYFLVGAFASAVLIYGIALVYGMTGTTNLVALGAAGQTAPAGMATVDPASFTSPIFLIGSFLIAAALAFKIAAVPFHLWAPDAYEGAPTPVTAFMAAGVKAAGFATVVRVFATAYGRPELTFGPGGWASLAAVLAMLTMTLGNLAALRQDNLKRMLAYSSIAHAGYLLVGVSAMGLIGEEARGPLLYYLLAYTVTTVGSFGMVAWIGSYGEERQHLDDWAGLAARHPAAALGMTLFLLSLGGIPPTAGFFGKFYLFRAALMKPGLLPLVIVAVANSVVSVFYYLRPVTAMYFREVGREPTPVRSSGVVAALVVAALATLLLGLLPHAAIDFANHASLLLPVGK
jgi:NADH-quinone oxidoreductase subunit N